MRAGERCQTESNENESETKTLNLITVLCVNNDTASFCPTTATPKALPVFSLLLCAAHSHFLCTSRRAAGLRTVRAAGAAPNVVIDVRLMAINVINLNKKQYGKTTTTTLAQCKLIARNGKSTKPTADCVRLCCICFVRFFGISFGFRGDFMCCLYYLLLPFGNSCLKMTIGRPSRS